MKKNYFIKCRIAIFILFYYYIIMLRKLLSAAIAVLLQFVGHAQTPTWATNVAPILYNHCTTCHHDGGIAPFSLITYSEAVLHALEIKADVQSKKMPPWTPDPAYSHLAHERILSTTEISTIVNWVNGTTPQGTLSLAPPAPVYGTKGSIPGTPDLVVKIPVYTSTAASGDVYQCFVRPSGLTDDQYISAFEAVPGNPACVHHVLVYSDTTGACAALEAGSAMPPGYPSFGGVGSSDAVMLGGWVPGSAPMSYPSGFGVRLAKGADIVIQVHYPAGTVGMKDSTEIHFFFSKASPVRNVTIEPLLYHQYPIINAPLFIPANTTQTFYETLPSFALSTDLSLLSLAPHMHLVGRSIKSYAIHPAGDTDQLISIPKWDFHWQGFYMLPKIKKIPAGSTLKAEAFYDNTTANPENPNAPPKDVSAGESTTDEMMLVFFAFTDYQAGDENILIDSTKLAGIPELQNYYHGQQLLDVCPNPAINDIVVKCYLDEQDQGSITLLDAQGRTVKRFLENGRIKEGYTAATYSVKGLAAGNYLLQLKTTHGVLTRKVVVGN
jgi:hypothetical protein